MSLNGRPDLIAKIDRLAEIASLDYQTLQLAAQRADVEGFELAAGVLRSVSEGHAGKAHALMTLAGKLKQDAQDGGGTKGYLKAAVRRSGEVEQLSADLIERAKSVLDTNQVQDITAIVALTATNRQRLERLLAGLSG